VLANVVKSGMGFIVHIRLGEDSLGFNKGVSGHIRRYTPHHRKEKRKKQTYPVFSGVSVASGLRDPSWLLAANQWCCCFRLGFKPYQASLT